MLKLFAKAGGIGEEACGYLNFHLVEEIESYHTAYQLHEGEERFRLTAVMDLPFIEIPKLLKYWKDEKLDP